MEWIAILTLVVVAVIVAKDIYRKRDEELPDELLEILDIIEESKEDNTNLDNQEQ